MVRKYFGTDGIRGRANGVITPELALKVGQAAGLVFQRGEHRHRVVIGKDTRLSGYMIETALVAGFTSVGMDVLLTGPMPTPAVGMLTRSMRADLGVMISASHNPYDDNGIKLFGPGRLQAVRRGRASDRSADRRRAGQAAGEERRPRPRQAHRRRAGSLHRIRQAHLPRNLSLDGLRVVIDCANGAAYRVAPEALWELGAEVITIGVEPGRLQHQQGMRLDRARRALPEGAEMRADIGIALDGDADRVLIVDERGHIVDGDQLLAVIAESWKDDGRLAKPGVVATVMSNLGLERYLERLGIVAGAHAGRRPLRARAHARARLQSSAAKPSGHIILSDYTTTGDGLVAALQVLAVVKKQDQPVSEVCHRFDPLPQVLKNVRYKSGKPLENAKVRIAIEDAEARLNGHGRLMIRPSGTEPVIRVMGEGDDKVLVEEVVDGIVEALTDAAA